MHILVSGGAGYCGSVAVAELLAAGHSVVVFDNLATGFRTAVDPGAAFVEGDLCDADAVARVFQQERAFDGILHFASASLVGESMRQPLRYLRDNLVGATNLLEQAVARGVERFIFSSTANLFGTPDTIPIPPDAPVTPGSPYGESKYFIERTLAWFAQIYGLRYACLRYFNAAGATQQLGEAQQPPQRFIPMLLDVALGLREQITIFGSDYPTRDGSCVRDYIHVVDLAQAHILALGALDRLGSRTYNLGSGAGFTNLEVIAAARRITGHPIPCTVGPRRPGDAAALVADATLAQSELGWQPQHSTLDAMIGSAWAWRQAHPHGYLGAALSAVS